jgi:trigger factor
VKLTVERLPESRALLDITAGEDEFAQAMDRAYRKIAREVVLPGFRKGKAPRGIIERTYGRQMFLEEAHKEIMEDLFRKALAQEELVPVGDPEVEITEIDPVRFTVTVQVYPTVDPGNYHEVRVESGDATVDTAAVEEVVNRLRLSQSPWVDPAEPRSPRDGDQVTVDLAVTKEGEAFQEPVEDQLFVLGESNMLEPLVAAIETLALGETKTFDLSFGEDDLTVNEAIRGVTLTYTVTLKGVKEREQPALDDAFAQSVSDAETMDQLRTEIRDDLHQGRTNEVRTEVLNTIINRMAEGATIELPAALVDSEIDKVLETLRRRLVQSRSTLPAYLRATNQTEAQLREELRPDATRRTRNSLLVREIARREEIAVSDDEVASDLAALRADSPVTDQAREMQAREFLLGVLRDDLFERRVSERLIEIATGGQGAVRNAWTAPEPEPEPEPEAEPVPEAERTSEPAALAAALTTGTMPGQPGELAATATSDDPEGRDAVTAVAAAEPDPAQAAAVAHSAENARVAADAPAGAVPPAEREREAQGQPDQGGVFADPET